MKKGFISPIMVCLWAAWALAGGRKAPDASADREVCHGKSSLESQLESIRAEPDETEPGETQPDEGESGGSVDALVGTEENGVWIRAELPKVPLTMPTLMLRQRWNVFISLLCRQPLWQDWLGGMAMGKFGVIIRGMLDQERRNGYGKYSWAFPGADWWDQYFVAVPQRQHGGVVCFVGFVSCQTFCSGSFIPAGRRDIYYGLPVSRGCPCDVWNVGNVSAKRLV